MDRQTGTLSWSLPLHWNAIALAVLAAFFVLVGATDLDLGAERRTIGPGGGRTIRTARSGRRLLGARPVARDRFCPVSCSRSSSPEVAPARRPFAGRRHWRASSPGCMLSRRMMSVMGRRAGLLLGVCWFGSIALIDRSGAIELDLIVGLATLAALDRLMTAGAGWVAGALGVAGVSFGRTASAHRDRPGDRRHGPQAGLAVACVHHPAARDCDPLVCLDKCDCFTGALRNRAGSPVHPETGVAPRIGRIRPRPSL